MDHTCQSPRCRGERLGTKFCEYHRCSVVGCEEEAIGETEGVCGGHGLCVEPGCSGRRFVLHGTTRDQCERREFCPSSCVCCCSCQHRSTRRSGSGSRRRNAGCRGMSLTARRLSWRLQRQWQRLRFLWRACRVRHQVLHTASVHETHVCERESIWTRALPRLQV